MICKQARDLFIPPGRRIRVTAFCGGEILWLATGAGGGYNREASNILNKTDFRTAAHRLKSAV